MPLLVIESPAGHRVVSLDRELQLGPKGHGVLRGADLPQATVSQSRDGWTLVLDGAPIPLAEDAPITVGEVVIRYVAGDGVALAAPDPGELARRGLEAASALQGKDRPDTVARVIDTAIEVTSAARGFLLLRGASGLSVAATRGFSGTADDAELRVSHTIAQRAFRGRHAIHTADARQDHRFLDAESVQTAAIGSVICAPLLLKGEPLGVLYLDRPPAAGPFAREALALAEPLGIAAAEAVARAERFSETVESLRDARAGLLLQARALEGWTHAGGKFDSQSAAARGLLELLERVAPSEASLLIWGETGVGKDLVAQLVHARSTRREGRLEALPCGGLPSELLDAELFGFTKGAFTGAEADHPGLFARADGGTVLLDGVDEMSPELQVRLLRVLEERKVRPLGADDSVVVDFRLVATLRCRPDEALAAGRLREDLYHRLATLTIEVPPLRQRREDILPLATRFLEEERGAQSGARLTPESVTVLERYPWPGNVRELRNEVVRASLRADGKDIRPEHLSPAVRGEEARPDHLGLQGQVRPLTEVERDAIVQALEAYNGNRLQVARALGLARSTLYKRLEQYGLA